MPTLVSEELLVRDHHYLSTACYHGRHRSCTNQCVWCHVTCLCPCHPDPHAFVKAGR